MERDQIEYPDEDPWIREKFQVRTYLLTIAGLNLKGYLSMKDIMLRTCGPWNWVGGRNGSVTEPFSS